MTENIIDTDILIIGSEGAGGLAAIEANKHKVRVTVATKGGIARSGATLTGGADLSVDSKSLHDLGFKMTDVRDTPELFFEDTVKGGKYLNNQKIVDVTVKEAPARLKDFMDMGAKKYFWPNAFYASGHRYTRGAFIRGYDLVRVLKDQLAKRRIEVIEYVMVTDLLTRVGHVVGAVGINIRTGDFVVFKAKAVVLATGGMMEIYPYSTAPIELTGDGQAMAYQSGAELVDMEFPMFISGVFAWPPPVKHNLLPMNLATAGEVRGWLLNRWGQRFMEKWDPKHMEQTTRDILSIAIMTEVMEGRGSPHGGVYVSLKHLPDNLIDYIGKWIFIKNWEFGSFDYKLYMPDLRKGAVEMIPACHFTNGGIKINENSETNLPGLFAAGEVTGGLHGANRLSGNAFSEFTVWGPKAGKAAAEYALKARSIEVEAEQVEKLRKKVLLPLERKEGIRPVEVKRQIQKLAWEKVGIIKSSFGLNEAIKEIKRMWKDTIPHIYAEHKGRTFNKDWVGAIEVKNMLLGLEMHARTALMRTESRGAHYRKDYPNTDYINWTKNIIVKQLNGEMHLTIQPVVITKLKPPEKVAPYGVVD